jgi:hypothetical protein
MLTVILWPLLLLLANLPWLNIGVLIALNSVLWALVWKSCSTPKNSFLNGLGVIAAALSSGCANITILYVLPFLVIVYVIFIFYSLIGLFRGPQYPQAIWTRFTGQYYAILAKRMGKK